MPDFPFWSLTRVPGSVGFFTASAAARLGVAMFGMGLLWTIHDDGRSFAVAGGVVGVFALAEALVAPQVARAMDRYGQPRALPPLIAVHAVALILLVMSVVTSAALPVLWAAAALAGASIPQPGALSAVRWNHALAGRELLRTAFSLEAVANDVAFIVGPALVVAIGALTEPLLGTATAAVLVVGGSTGLALQGSSAPPPSPRRGTGAAMTRRAGGGWGRTFAVLLVVNVALGALFGALALSIAAAAVEHQAMALSGVVYSVMSVTSLLGGIAYGSRTWAWTPHHVLLAAATYLVVVTVLLQATIGMRSLALVVALIGLAVAPLCVVSTILTQAAVPAGGLTQALVWFGSASAAGVAAGSAATGVVAQAYGSAGGFLVATAAAVVMTLAALADVTNHPRLVWTQR